MSWKYKVVLFNDLVTTSPALWQTPLSRSREWAAMIEESLDRMADDGWEFVDSFVPAGAAVLPVSYMIFRRHVTDSDGATQSQETAFKAVF